MDFKDFQAAAYLNSGANNKNNKDNKKADNKKQQTGEVIHGGFSSGSGSSPKPVSFKPMNLTDFGKTKNAAEEKSKNNGEQPESFNNFAALAQSLQGAGSTGGADNSNLKGRKISTPSWAHVEKNPVGRGEGQPFTRAAGNQPKKIKTVKQEEKQNISPSQRLENATDYLKSGGLLKVPIEEPKEGGKDSAYRKVAKFLVLIGEEEAAKVLPHLSEAQIERIIPEIASIRTVSKEEAAVIFEEFNSIVKQVQQQGGVETAREMLVKAYGQKRADEMIKKAMPMEGKTPFAYLKDLDKERLYLLLKDENPGMQALVLSYLDPKKSAQVINLMEPEAKKDLVMRLAKMEPVSPEVLRRVDQAMHEKSLNQTGEESENIDGRNALAQILKRMDISTENEILANLDDEDPDLGLDLRSRLFTLDDVINADDRFIQEKLHEMSEVDIAYLLAGKNNEFKEKILSNISANRRAEVREQDEILSVKRRSDCEKITADFLGKLRAAFEAGDLIIKDRNDDEFI